MGLFIVAWNPDIARAERKCSVELLDILDGGRGVRKSQVSGEDQ